jgi:uncharacterized membrane protein YfcA
MDELLLVALAGFVASLVDGALGMGFGPTSSSILLGTGLSPAAVSTTVNLAKVATGLSAAISHWRFAGQLDVGAARWAAYAAVAVAVALAALRPRLAARRGAAAPIDPDELGVEPA